MMQLQLQLQYEPNAGIYRFAIDGRNLYGNLQYTLDSLTVRANLVQVRQMVLHKAITALFFCFNN